MKVSDIQNVIGLARQGVKVLADSVDAQQGAQAFASIAAVEQWLNSLIAQQQAQQEASDENGQSVEVVEVNNEEVANTEDTEDSTPKE